MEYLDRGVVAVPAQGGGILVSWRFLGNDPDDVAFNLYRGSTLLNSAPLAGATNFVDSSGTTGAQYTVRPVVNGVETADGAGTASVWGNGYLSIPLTPPPSGVTPANEAYDYVIKEASAGDLDGDGQYEIILKWDPTNDKDNAQAGYTGEVYIDAYRLNGARLWRINLGKNIRAGSHYTQFQVFDYDGDGRAEVAMRTSDGTVDGTGDVIGNPTADWRDNGSTSTPSTAGQPPRMQGKIISGPEYLTVFNGLTGKAMASAPYWPQRGNGTDNPTRAQLNTIWGDDYANRSDRFLAGTAYLDGQRPSIIMARGYYARSTIAAWDYRNGQLTQRWTFDSAIPGLSAYSGQGNHQLSVADVDEDGKDEIIYGSMAIDDNGTALWSTGLRHGDALHVGDLIPSRPGLERWGPHEESGKNGGIGASMVDARTGEVIWSRPGTGDVARGVVGDIDPRYPGAEAWTSSETTVYTAEGVAIPGAIRPAQSIAFMVWWDSDDTREFFHENKIVKYDWNRNGSLVTLLTAVGMEKSNGTKNTPVLSADLLGDWREEVIWRRPDNREIRLYTTPYASTRRLTTLMHDAQYRCAIAWQNTAYNQPPHPSFFLGEGMVAPPRSDMVVRKYHSAGS